MRCESARIQGQLLGYCHCESCGQWCKTCGGHILTEHPAMGLTDVYAAILPKQKDVPAEPGGSGVTLAE